MDICLNINSEKKVNRILRAKISKLIEYALRKLHTESACVSINFVSRRIMQQMNRKYRGKDRVTDVLSFAVYDGSPAEFIGVNDLGDIFICIPVIEKQAREFGVTVEEELFRMLVHGLLHLLGYDHEKSKKEEKKMFDLQEKILEDYAKKENE